MSIEFINFLQEVSKNEIIFCSAMASLQPFSLYTIKAEYQSPILIMQISNHTFVYDHSDRCSGAPNQRAKKWHKLSTYSSILRKLFDADRGSYFNLFFHICIYNTVWSIRSIKIVTDLTILFRLSIYFFSTVNTIRITRNVKFGWRRIFPQNSRKLNWMTQMVELRMTIRNVRSVVAKE